MAEERKQKLELTHDETRLIALHRAIKSFDKPQLITAEEASSALTLLKVTVEDLKGLEGSLSSGELKTLLKGFVAGLAASRVQEVPYEVEEELPQSGVLPD